MMLWAASLLASKPGQSNHGVCLLEAADKDAALGRALRIARKAYPASEGWSGHHVMVCLSTNVIDPDGQVTSTPAG